MLWPQLGAAKSSFHLRVITALHLRKWESSVFTFPPVLQPDVSCIPGNIAWPTHDPANGDNGDGCICPTWHCKLKTAYLEGLARSKSVGIVHFTIGRQRI